MEIRESLQSIWKAQGASRDVLLLDIALDNYFRTMIERNSAGDMEGDHLLSVIELVSKLPLKAAPSTPMSSSIEASQMRIRCE